MKVADAPRVEVSVALAAYNGTRWLGAQVESVLSQLNPQDEIVAVDDGSTDGTAALLLGRNDPRIRLLRNEGNRGVRASFELALAACRGQFIFLCDHDDIWLPGKRDALVAQLRAGALLALCDASMIDADGRQIAPSFMASRGGFRGSVASTLLKSRYLGCAMAFRRELLTDVLPIPTGVPMHDMWIGALASLRGRVAYVDRPLMKYRRHGGNASPHRRAGLAQLLAWRWGLLRAVVARLVLSRHSDLDLSCENLAQPPPS